MSSRWPIGAKLPAPGSMTDHADDENKQEHADEFNEIFFHKDNFGSRRNPVRRRRGLRVKFLALIVGRENCDMLHMKRFRLFLLLASCFTAASAVSQTISVPDNFARLVAQEDNDGDKKITVHDRTTPFEILATNGAPVEEITGTYHLSILLQHLKRAEDEDRFRISVSEIPLNENIVDRTHRLIREFYWDALTRRIDAAHVDQVVHDPKVQSKDDYIYVPASDMNAVSYFKSIEAAENAKGRSPALKVVVLPPIRQNYRRICLRLG